ncbi:MAG: hypothetical protein M3138_04250, partial [Actinomycetota bacterium]|nr:hypothetical protein [Actinomycetota bacterium]
MRRKTAVAAASALGMALMAWGGLALACTAVPRILSITPVTEASGTTGEPVAFQGSPVLVRGEAMGATVPVELRWNSSAGPIIGIATTDAKGNFAATATVPQAAPGVHTVVAMVGKRPIARMTYEVGTGSAGAATGSVGLGTNGSSVSSDGGGSSLLLG